MKWLLAALIALATPAAALADEDPAKVTPLFADDTPLEITLSGHIRTIAGQAESSTAAHPARLFANGESHAIELSARGVSRRKKENCRFPPLRIVFPDKPEKMSLFHKQGSIKLVTHCNESDRSEQYVLREYAAYRLYNKVTPESLRVRLVRVNYEEDGEVITTRPGFLIEDADDAARRLGMKEVDIGKIASSQLFGAAAARLALFQYMIGNTDWAMVVGPDPADCCHNAKLLGASKQATNELVPVPYDFDSSGLVDAPYAFPAAQLGTQSVKTRVYRGFCSLNPLIPAEAAKLRALRPELETELADVPGLDDKTRDAMRKYLGGFFEDIADDKKLARKILKRCR